MSGTPATMVKRTSSRVAATMESKGLLASRRRTTRSAGFPTASAPASGRRSSDAAFDVTVRTSASFDNWPRLRRGA